MKTKTFITILLCLICMGLISCDKKKNEESSTTSLSNTKWEGTALKTNIKVPFTTEECYIQASGYATGVAVGTYKTNQSDLFITVTNTSGDFDGQLSKGDILIGTFDLKAKTMSIELTLYGQPQKVSLTMI